MAPGSVDTRFDQLESPFLGRIRDVARQFGGQLVQSITRGDPNRPTLRAKDLIGKEGVTTGPNGQKIRVKIHKVAHDNNLSWIFLAKFKIEGEQNWCRDYLAAKWLNLSACDPETQWMASTREATIWKSLRHEHIIEYWGTVTADPRHSLFISSWMENGDLIDYYGKNLKLTDRERVTLAKQYMSAFLYMHRKGYVHGDIKPPNIFISPQGKALVGDFGLSRSLEPDGTGPTTSFIRSLGSSRYIAQELLEAAFPVSGGTDAKYRSKTPESDVWSVGCLIYYTITRIEPYADATSSSQVIARHRTRQLPPNPEPTKFRRRMPDRAYKFVQRCWDYNPARRPSMREVHDFIAAL